MTIVFAQKVLPFVLDQLTSFYCPLVPAFHVVSGSTDVVGGWYVILLSVCVDMYRKQPFAMLFVWCVYIYM